MGGAVSASAVALSYTNDLTASAQAQLNALRDGSHTAKVALVATRAVSASSAEALGGVDASGFARIDSGVAGNVFSATPTVTNIQTFTGYSAYHRMWAKQAAAGTQGWIVNYAVSDSGPGTRGRLIPVALTEDSGTYQSTVVQIVRTVSWVESFYFYVGPTGGSAAFRAVVNGVNYDLTDPIRLNGVAAAAYARLDTARTFSKGTGSTPVNVAYGSTISINCEDGDFHRITLTGSATLAAPSAPRPGQTLVIALTQGGSGSYTVTWNSVFRFAGGSTPTLTTTVGGRDVFAFIYDDLAGHWLQAGLDVKR